MVDIETDPITHQKVKKLRETNISVFDSKYWIGFEIPTPVSPNLYCSCLVLEKVVNSRYLKGWVRLPQKSAEYSEYIHYTRKLNVVLSRQDIGMFCLKHLVNSGVFTRKLNLVLSRQYMAGFA